MEIAKRREKTRHSGIPGFQQYFKSKSQININNNWKNIQQQQQKTTENTFNIQQKQQETTISIQQQENTTNIQQQENTSIQQENTISIQQQQENTTNIQQQENTSIQQENTISIQQQQENTTRIQQQQQQQQQQEKTINIQQQQQERTISIQQQENTTSIQQQQQQEKTISIQQQQECIMNEESFEDVSYMPDSFECMVDGYPCIINELKGDDSLAKYVKRLKDISFYHGCNQESTMEILDLVKYKLEHLKELQSRNIITNTMNKIKEKFRRIFCQ